MIITLLSILFIITCVIVIMAIFSEVLLHYNEKLFIYVLVILIGIYFIIIITLLVSLVMLYLGGKIC